LYATVNYSLLEKKKQYEPHIHEMLDLILEKGRNKHGMFYNVINPQTGDISDRGISDTWGYVYNGFYTVYLIDSIERYRDAVLFTLNNLDNYRKFNWERWRSDGFADAVESAIHLYHREPLPDLKYWIDSEIDVMWSLQDSSMQENAGEWVNSGIIDGDHCDGNFARTTIMYCLWKSQGTTLTPWRDDINLGACFENNQLYISIKSNEKWEGSLLFDIQRHNKIMELPFDWPRINKFPEWFTADQNKQYEVKDLLKGSTVVYSGSDLARGIPIELMPDTEYKLIVRVL
jgi:hypothetical protein